MNNTKNHSIKLLIVGDSGVGKTSLLMRYCEDQFHTDYLSTIGVDFKVKKLQVQDHHITMNIWDTAGQQRFRNITKTFYKGAQGVILTYSITDLQSYLHIGSWIQQIKDNGSSTANMILVGSKSDLDKQRKVSKKQGKEIGQKFGIPFIETSSKDNNNIAKTFEILAKKIVQKIKNGELETNLDKEKLKKKKKKQFCC